MTKKGTSKQTKTNSKRFDHVTDDFMSLFCSWKKLSVRTLLSLKFSLPCDKRLTLHSPRPSFPQIWNVWRQLAIFKYLTQLKPQICYLFFTRLWNLVIATKKTHSEIVTWLKTSLPYMWLEKIFYDKCYLVVAYKAFQKLSSKDSGRFFYDNYNLLL